MHRSTPVESLHSILLGPYKYLLKSTIPLLSDTQKEEVNARIRAFSYSGFQVRLHGNVIRYHQSFVGRDYKAWAQMALFIIYCYLSDEDKKVWLALSKVFEHTARCYYYTCHIILKIFMISYCNFYDPGKATEWKAICKTFVDTVSCYKPHMMKKQKIHLMLHLIDCMEQFGPTSAFNSERYAF